MALKHSYTKFGVEFAEAYSKITNISYNSRSVPTFTEDLETGDQTQSWETLNEIDYIIETFPTAADREANTEIMGRKSFTFQPDWETETNTLVTQCYEHAKLQPEFTGAIDA